MNLPGKLVTLASCAMLLISCKGEEPSSDTHLVSNPMLKFAPAKTPYLLANLEETPAEVVDAYLAIMQPGLDLLQSMAQERQQEDPDITGHTDAATRLFSAALAELDGKLNRAGMESLGLSLQSHKAFYGMGMFPVFRVGLHDTAAFEATMSRIEERAGVTLPQIDTGAAQYWKFSAEDQPLAVYMHIAEEHLAIGVWPVDSENSFLPDFLGQGSTQLEAAHTQSLAQLNRDKEFTAFGSGYVDFRLMKQEMLDAESVTNRSLVPLGVQPHAQFEPICAVEFDEITDRVPRMVTGLTELSGERVEALYQFEMNESLGRALALLVTDTPPASKDENHVLAMAFALQIGKVRDYLLEKASDRIANRYQCSALQTLNELADQTFSSLNRPLPPFAGNLNGFRMMLTEMDFENPEPQTSRGLMVVEVEKPQMLVGTAQMFIPGLDGINLVPGAGPVEIPPEMLGIEMGESSLFAAMTNDSVGVGVGIDEGQELDQFINASGNETGAFLSVGYDMEAQKALEKRLSEMASDLDTSSMQSVALRHTYMSMHFTPAGLTIRSAFSLRP